MSGPNAESVRLAEIEKLRSALELCERALRDQPMQAFRDKAQRRRAEALDAARDALDSVSCRFCGQPEGVHPGGVYCPLPIDGSVEP